MRTRVRENRQKLDSISASWRSTHSHWYYWCVSATHPNILRHSTSSHSMMSLCIQSVYLLPHTLYYLWVIHVRQSEWLLTCIVHRIMTRKEIHPCLVPTQYFLLFSIHSHLEVWLPHIWIWGMAVFAENQLGVGCCQCRCRKCRHYIQRESRMSNFCCSKKCKETLFPPFPSQLNWRKY